MAEQYSDQHRRNIKNTDLTLSKQMEAIRDISEEFRRTNPAPPVKELPNDKLESQRLLKRPDYKPKDWNQADERMRKKNIAAAAKIYGFIGGAAGLTFELVRHGGMQIFSQPGFLQKTADILAQNGVEAAIAIIVPALLSAGIGVIRS